MYIENKNSKILVAPSGYEMLGYFCSLYALFYSPNFRQWIYYFIIKNKNAQLKKKKA